MAVSAEFDAAQATNAVGLDLYRQLASANPAANLVLSPYSIESALALAYAGADGDTRREMSRALRLPDDNSALESGFAKLQQALTDMASRSEKEAAQARRFGGKADPIQWTAANRLFGQQGHPFRSAFLAQMNDRFGAPFEPMDFARDPEGSRGRINRWVEDQTRQKIKNLIPERGLDPLSRMVLVNALYLKASWETPFYREFTQPQSFHAPSGQRPVPMMHRRDQLGYTADEGLTVVSLDYLGGDLHLLLVLPDTGLTIGEAANRLTVENLSRWARLRGSPSTTVSLYLPKFRVAGGSLKLAPALQTLSMTSAFDPTKADFGRIMAKSDSDWLVLAEVFHQTFIAVDETGTEAAAATAVLAARGGAGGERKLVEVRVDRPFLFAIQHRATGACLFLGRITEPGR